MKYIIILALTLNCSIAADLTCPDGTSLIDVTLSSGRRIWCQKTVSGEYIKHGPEIIYVTSGKISSQKYYKEGKEAQAPASSFSQKKKVTLASGKKYVGKITGDEIKRIVDQTL